MPILLGTETEQSAAETFVEQKPGSCKVISAVEGIVTAINIKLKAGSSATKALLGISTAGTETSKPAGGTVLAEGEVTVEGTKIEITGLSVSITNGTTYWLTALPLNGSLKTTRHSEVAGTQVAVETGKVKTIAEAIAVAGGGWLNENKGPYPIAATGTEGAAVTSRIAMLI